MAQEIHDQQPGLDAALVTHVVACAALIRPPARWLFVIPLNSSFTSRAKPIVSFDKTFGGLSVLCAQAGDVNTERGAVDHPPFSLDHHPVCGMGAAQHQRRQWVAGARKRTSSSL